MWGLLIGAGLSLAGSVLGGAASASKAKKAQAELDAQRAKNESWYSQRSSENAREKADKERDNESWYRSRYYQDYTQTAEAVNAMRQAREAAREQNDRVRGQQVVSGGTDASAAAAKEASAKAVGDTAANIAAQGTARKDAIEGRYLSRKDAIDNNYTTQRNALDSQYMSTNNQLAQQQIGVYNQQAQNAAAAGSAIASAGGTIMGAAVNNMFKAKS